MLTLLQSLRKMWIALNGDVSPFSCGAAVFIGCLLGLTPGGIQTVLLLLLLLIFTVPVSVALVTSAILKLLDLVVLKSLTESLGEMMLREGTVTRGLVVTLLDIPVVGLVPLERHGVLGGISVGVILGLLLWIPVMRGISSYRRALRATLTGHRLYKSLSKFSWLFGGALKGGKLA